MIPIVEPIKGKYTSAHVMIDEIDSATYEQIIQFINHEAFTNHVAIMPDCHKGNGAVIGFTMPLTDKVIPNVIGVDINCGMLSMNVGRNIFAELTREKINEIIRRSIPFGTNVHRKDLKSINDIFFNELSGKLQSFLKKYGAKRDYEYNRDKFIRLCDRVGMNFDRAIKSIGTLGGGNHFIEIQKCDDGFLYIMIHSGSRNLGNKVGQYYNKIAIKLNEKWKSQVPKSWQLAFLPFDSKEGKMYFREMQYCVDFAFANRKLMMEKVKEAMSNHCDVSFDENSFINIAHNYAVMENHFGENVLVHRKGATKADKKIFGIIPGSQGTNSYIVKGKENRESRLKASFNSCSHGAGRIMSRSKARKKLNLDDERSKLDNQGIIHSIRSKKDLDEASGAYKDIDEVMDHQKDLVDIVKTLTPLAVIKG